MRESPAVRLNQTGKAMAEAQKKKAAPSSAGDVAWNTAGTFYYFLCQWLLTVLAVRLGSYEDAGVFSMVISVTNIFYCISVYGVRNYQMADISNRFTDRDYVSFRYLTSLISLALFAVCLPFLSLSAYTAVCCVIYLFYKYGESYSDVLFGIFQKHDSVKKIAVSYFLKGTVSLLLFWLVMVMTHSLFWTIAFNTIGIWAVVFIYDLTGDGRRLLAPEKLNRITPLLRLCFPLMMYSMLVPYLNFIIRYTVEKQFGTETLGYYSSVTMVLSVLMVLMNSVFVILIPKMTKMYADCQFGKLTRMVAASFAGFAVMLAAGLAAGWLLGGFLFSLVFGEEILDYMYLLGPTITAAVILSAVTFYSSVLTSFHRNSMVLAGNAVSAVICTLLSWPFCTAWGLGGTLTALNLALAFSLAVLLVMIFIVIRRRKTAGISREAA